ncbi:transglutaminase [Sneathiella sp. P13V-1]|uniref:transglutaminase-like domain-containing protein n=1 Tax=Sneathiella sp. P13V-1 TaxID=2697366 RepID=UPI00187BAC57|nr:transglutaminase family protein [Sneathiella sp. P13V-1]MBE7638621.1 transglutaminase [Sneathiella sp. P13V-1]
MLDLVGLPAEELPDSWTKAGEYVDADHPAIAAFIAMSFDGHDPKTDREKAILLFNGVRDLIRYNPYQINFDAPTYKASAVAKMESAFCVPKAILLTACLRQVGISAAVGFADVKNHLNSPKLAAAMGTDLFSYHGYVTLKLDGEIYKVTPTFNKDLCDRFGVKAIEFDGTSDALFHEYDAEERKHMEYVKDRGIYEDPPMEDLLSDLGELYPAMKEALAKEKVMEEDSDFAA